MSRVVGIRTGTGTHRAVLLFIRHTELIAMVRMSVLPMSGHIVTCCGDKNRDRHTQVCVIIYKTH